MKIIISRAAFIAAASIVQGKQDVRHYLNGILIEKGPDDHPLIVATDGHRLVAALDENGLCSDDMPDSVIIQFGAETLRAAKLAKNLELPFVIDVRAPLEVHVDIGGLASHDSETIDGKFPDWRRVSTDNEGTSAGWYSAQYVADFEKVGKFLSNGCKYKSLTIRADDALRAATVFFGGIDYAFGELMPMRVPDLSIESVPQWAAGPLKKAA